MAEEISFEITRIEPVKWAGPPGQGDERIQLPAQRLSYDGPERFGAWVASSLPTIEPSTEDSYIALVTSHKTDGASIYAAWAIDALVKAAEDLAKDEGVKLGVGPVTCSRSANGAYPMTQDETFMLLLKRL